MYRDEALRDFARSMRNEPTDAEGRLWWFLRAEKLSCKFRRQACIGSYIVDFVCFTHQLVVELDGPQHLEEEQRKYDQRRTDWLTSQGFRVLRFRNQELDEDIQGVVRVIQDAIETSVKLKRSTPPQPSP